MILKVSFLEAISSQFNQKKHDGVRTRGFRVLGTQVQSHTSGTFFIEIIFSSLRYQYKNDNIVNFMYYGKTRRCPSNGKKGRRRTILSQWVAGPFPQIPTMSRIWSKVNTHMASQRDVTPLFFIFM